MSKLLLIGVLLSPLSIIRKRVFLQYVCVYRSVIIVYVLLLLSPVKRLYIGLSILVNSSVVAVVSGDCTNASCHTRSLPQQLPVVSEM